MSKRRLKSILSEMGIEDLQGVYNCFWKNAENYSEEDLREHIAKYIITFYKMSAYKSSCKEKCYFLIKQIEYLGE